MLKKFALTLMLLGAFAAPMALAQDDADGDVDEMQADDDTEFGDEDVVDDEVVDEEMAVDESEDMADSGDADETSEDMAEPNAEEESIGDVSDEAEEEAADSDRDDAGDLADESSADSEGAPVTNPPPQPIRSTRNDDATPNSANWPAEQFTFEVDVSGVGTGKFREVSGLESEAQAIEYRHGNSPVFSNQKMPGLAKVGNITLKGPTQGSSFSAWRARTTVTIKLLDQAGNPTMVWTLQNAWPTKISGSSIEIAHEGLTISNM